MANQSVTGSKEWKEGRTWPGAQGPRPGGQAVAASAQPSSAASRAAGMALGRVRGVDLEIEERVRRRRMNE